MKLTTLLLFILSFTACAPTEAPKPAAQATVPVITIGKLVKFKGSVLKNNKEIILGETFNEGDTVETKNKSFAQLEMHDDTTINVGANSKLVLKRYVIDPDAREVNINLLIGKIKTHFRKKLIGTKGKLEVTTSSACFGVRGTEFITQSSEAGKTKMLLLEGKVSLTKHNKDSTKAPDVIEIKPMELVTTEENSEVIETSVVKEADIPDVTTDEELNLNLDSVKAEPQETKIEPKIEELPKSSSTSSPDAKVQDFLLSLEHKLQAIPVKTDGKIVYFGDDKSLIKNKAGQVVALDPDSDTGDKKYRVPVVNAQGEKSYMPVSEQALLKIISQSANIGIAVPKGGLTGESIERKPASFGP